MIGGAVSRPAWSQRAFTLVAISRAIVFVGLALFITTLYLSIVVVTGALTGGRAQPSIWLPVLSVAVVAIAFQPLRERLQRLADQLVYGQRATPYDAMVGLARRMASALAADEVLPRTAEAAARSVGARRGQATLYLSDGQERSAEWPLGSTATAPENEVAIRDRGERIGTISVVMPGHGPSAHATLLSNVAIQAAPAFRNMRLTADLEARLQEVSLRALEIQASRQRLVSSEEAARIRFQQEIQRGPERQLQLTLDGLAAAEAELADDPNAGGRMLAGLADGVSQALDELRELARTVFPALLSDRGVVPALQDQIRKLGVQAEMQLDGDVSSRRFEPRLEAAIYFCGAAALHDASLQPRREPIVLKLEVGNGSLLLTLPTPTTATREDMQDRVDALGGRIEQGAASSLVVALPLPEPEIR